MPVKFDRECDIDLPKRLFSSWIPDEGPRAIVRQLEPSERALLEMRATALQIALQPFGEDLAVEADVAAMFSGFRFMRQRGEDVGTTVHITLAVLREFPAWAIRKACLSIAQDRANLNEKFAPNDAEIYGVAEDIVRLYREHHRQANALLSAPVEPPIVPRRPTKDKLEELLGRPIGEPKTGPHAHSIPTDGNHAKRIAADLAARKARNEALQAQAVPELKSEAAE